VIKPHQDILQIYLVETTRNQSRGRSSQSPRPLAISIFAVSVEKRGRCGSDPKCTVESSGFHQQNQNAFNFGMAISWAIDIFFHVPPVVPDKIPEQNNVGH
jgi:hypothetical protein